MRKIYISDVIYYKDLVKLIYSDGDIIFVSRSDYNRAFGLILSATKEEVIRDFSVSSDVLRSYI